MKTLKKAMSKLGDMILRGLLVSYPVYVLMMLLWWPFAVLWCVVSLLREEGIVKDTKEALTHKEYERIRRVLGLDR